MSVSSDLSGASTDGTFQRFTCSTAAVAAASAIGVSEHEVLLAANDPESAHPSRRGERTAAHVRGDLVAVVNLDEDLVVHVRKVVWITPSVALAAP